MEDTDEPSEQPGWDTARPVPVVRRGRGGFAGRWIIGLEGEGELGGPSKGVASVSRRPGGVSTP